MGIYSLIFDFMIVTGKVSSSLTIDFGYWNIIGLLNTVGKHTEVLELGPICCAFSIEVEK